VRRYETRVKAEIPYTRLASPNGVQPHAVDRDWPRQGVQVVTTCEAGVLTIHAKRVIDAHTTENAIVAALCRFETELIATGLLPKSGSPRSIVVSAVEDTDG